MPKYIVAVDERSTVYYRVTADNPDEALQKVNDGEDEGLVNIECHDRDVIDAEEGDDYLMKPWFFDQYIEEQKDMANGTLG